MGSNRLKQLTLLILWLVWFGLDLTPTFACTARIVMPPPGPYYEGRWDVDVVVVYGVVSEVEKNLEYSWLVRKLIQWRIISLGSNDELTPLHRVKLDYIYYFVGTGGKAVFFDLGGCSLPIPKVGERAIFFIRGKGENHTIVPVYESDGELFSIWLKQLQQDVKRGKEPSVFKPPSLSLP